MTTETRGPMSDMKKQKSQVELLEHVVKGIHIEGQDERNGRVMPRPMERISDEPPRHVSLRKKGRKSR